MTLNLQGLSSKLGRTGSPFRVQNKDFLHCRLKFQAEGAVESQGLPVRVLRGGAHCKKVVDNGLTSSVAQLLCHAVKSEHLNREFQLSGSRSSS